jgi:hypothetical protein
MRVYVEGIGLCGPGLPNWEAALPVLAGQADYVPAPSAAPPCLLLPPNERRRATHTVKFALAAGAEGFARSGRDPGRTSTVFTSSGGDGETIHAIMNTLAGATRELSPTRFHNSVHNAAAGYWSIASGAKAASSSICAHDDSFAAGLLEAVAQLGAEPAVAVIAYDVPYPSPLAELRPIGAAFAAALILSRERTDSAFASVDVALLTAPRAATEMASPLLRGLQASVPAARCLPLMAALAGQVGEVTLSYLGDMALSLLVAPVGNS